MKVELNEKVTGGQHLFCIYFHFVWRAIGILMIPLYSPNQYSYNLNTRLILWYLNTGPVFRYFRSGFQMLFKYRTIWWPDKLGFRSPLYFTVEVQQHIFWGTFETYFFIFWTLGGILAQVKGKNFNQGPSFVFGCWSGGR